VEYSRRIDDQIAELLYLRSRVVPEQLPGIADEDGALFLEHFAEIHGADGSIVWDGGTLSLVQAVASAPTAQPVVPDQQSPGPHVPRATPSPVDQVLAAPVGASLLDSEPVGEPVPKWMWLLPLTFLFVGGIIAWLLTRNTNRTMARVFLITGIVLTVVTLLTMRMSAGLIRAGQQMLFPGLGSLPQ
jgi:hypothetical protein